MSDHTPTTEEVRRQWAKKQRDVWGNPGLRTLRKAFDRWLAEVKAQAWEEGRHAKADYSAGHRDDCGGYEDCWCARYINPYRQGENK